MRPQKTHAAGNRVSYAGDGDGIKTWRAEKEERIRKTKKEIKEKPATVFWRKGKIVKRSTDRIVDAKGNSLT